MGVRNPLSSWGIRRQEAGTEGSRDEPGKRPRSIRRVIYFVQCHRNPSVTVILLSAFLYHGLIERAVPVTCVCARHAKGVLSARVNKSDPHDAEGLAQMARTGWFKAVRIKDEATHMDRARLKIRAQLIEAHRAMAGQLRGLLKLFGLRRRGLRRGAQALCARGWAWTSRWSGTRAPTADKRWLLTDRHRSMSENIYTDHYRRRLREINAPSTSSNTPRSVVTRW